MVIIGILANFSKANVTDSNWPSFEELLEMYTTGKHTMSDGSVSEFELSFMNIFPLFSDILTAHKNDYLHVSNRGNNRELRYLETQRASRKRFLKSYLI